MLPKHAGHFYVRKRASLQVKVSMRLMAYYCLTVFCSDVARCADMF